MRIKMAEAVSLAKLFGPGEVDWALGHAAVHARFAEADLPSILGHAATTTGASATHRAGEDRSLTQGTAGWAALGQSPSDDLEAMLRRLRLPHIRRHAPDVVATAKAQRWEPLEVLRALFAEEAAGRERAALITRRTAAGFPTGKTFVAWDEAVSSIPVPTQQALRTREWVPPQGEPRHLRPLVGMTTPSGPAVLV